MKPRCWCVDHYLFILFIFMEYIELWLQLITCHIVYINMHFTWNYFHLHKNELCQYLLSIAFTLVVNHLQVALISMIFFKSLCDFSLFCFYFFDKWWQTIGMNSNGMDITRQRNMKVWRCINYDRLMRIDHMGWINILDNKDLSRSDILKIIYNFTIINFFHQYNFEGWKKWLFHERLILELNK